MMVADLSLGFVDDGVACGMFEDVFIAVWRGAPSTERLTRIATACDLLASPGDGEITIIAVIEESSPPPDPRDALASAAAFDARPRIARSVGVLEGRDPWLASVLDTAALVGSLRRRANDTKFCTDLREAATWIARRQPRRDEEGLAFRESLLASVERVREHLAAHRTC